MGLDYWELYVDSVQCPACQGLIRDCAVCDNQGRTSRSRAYAYADSVRARNTTHRYTTIGGY